jgi:hypothetical protein
MSNGGIPPKIYVMDMSNSLMNTSRFSDWYHQTHPTFPDHLQIVIREGRGHHRHPPEEGQHHPQQQLRDIPASGCPPRGSPLPAPGRRPPELAGPFQLIPETSPHTIGLCQPSRISMIRPFRPRLVTGRLKL